MPEATGYSALEPERHAMVARDHLPRAARYHTDYDDGTSGETIHVLYWDGTIVRTMLDSAWLILHGALPTDPTQAESDAAVAAIAQAATQAQTDADALRQQVRALAQSTVGMRVDAAFTTAQLRSLLAVLLWKAGALNNDLTIKPLADWANR